MTAELPQLPVRLPHLRQHWNVSSSPSNRYRHASTHPSQQARRSWSHLCWFTVNMVITG